MQRSRGGARVRHVQVAIGKYLLHRVITIAGFVAEGISHYFCTLYTQNFTTNMFALNYDYSALCFAM